MNKAVMLYNENYTAQKCNTYKCFKILHEGNQIKH